MGEMELHRSQRAALEYIAAYARTRKAAARKVIDEIVAMSNLATDALAGAVANIKQHARVALHFHPDRPDAQMRTVAQSLLDCGIYKSQFETQLSNGSVSAFPGGARDEWERKIFGGAYQLEGVTAAHRPKYGALDLLGHSDGPSPRFGSCYFLSTPAVAARSTFTYLDSHLDPVEKGTYEELDDIVAALFAESFTRDFAIGEKDLSPPRLLERLLSGWERPFADPSLRLPTRNLNHYIEAQVHGDVRLHDDVDILVADPSFQGSETGRTLESLCERYQIQCFWHAGFVLAPDEVPADFRGPNMPSLAGRIAVEGRVDAAAIGRAAHELKRDPSAWADRGGYAEVLQELKLMWHVLVRFGHARGMARPGPTPRFHRGDLRHL
jgi:hypothetical protein